MVTRSQPSNPRACVAWPSMRAQRRCSGLGTCEPEAGAISRAGASEQDLPVAPSRASPPTLLSAPRGREDSAACLAKRRPQDTFPSRRRPGRYLRTRPGQAMGPQQPMAWMQTRLVNVTQQCCSCTHQLHGAHTCTQVVQVQQTQVANTHTHKREKVEQRAQVAALNTCTIQKHRCHNLFMSSLGNSL